MKCLVNVNKHNLLFDSRSGFKSFKIGSEAKDCMVRVT